MAAAREKNMGETGRLSGFTKRIKATVSAKAALRRHKTTHPQARLTPAMVHGGVCQGYHYLRRLRHQRRELASLRRTRASRAAIGA